MQALIHRMPLKDFDFNNPGEPLQGTSSYVVLPKVFVYTCFRDHRPTLSKRDLRVFRCVFVGYLAIQKATRVIIRLLGVFS